MNLDYSKEEFEFRARVRAWLADNIPAEPRPGSMEAAADYDRAWQRRLFDAGFAGVSWPRDYGGMGLSPFQLMIWYEECARAKAPSYMNTTYIALMHAGPTLIARGSGAQKAFYLPRILRGDDVWCQGFSEPGAGSDLAALSTRGVVDGDHLVVSGQKMWTSAAHLAKYQELLVRTDPSSKRHKGLTWIICDMDLPGIDIKPIRTMMNDAEVNMVFYDQVRIPLANVVGGMGEGWSVAMSTLAFERGTGFIGDQMSLAEKVETVIEMARKTRLPTGKLAIDDDEIARKLAFIKAETLALRSMTISSMSRIVRNGQPGVEGSVMKLMVTSTWKALHQVVAEILGPALFEYGDDPSTNHWTHDYLWSWVLTIAGGSSEIQREIIADRMLDLPRAR